MFTPYNNSNAMCLRNLVNWFYWVMLFAVLVLSACTPYKYIDIQTLRPADLPLPQGAHNAVVVAGLYKGVEGVEESMAQAALDSTAALESVLSLVETLSQSPLFYDEEIPVLINYRTDTSREIVPYNWSVVDSIAQTNNAETVISLEYMKLTPRSDSYSYWDGSLTAYYGYLSCRVYAYWRVYDTYSRTITSAYLHRDTVTWEKYDYVSVKIGQQLPELFSAAAYCGYETGLSYGTKIAPSWMDEKRIYYNKGNKQFKKAAELVKENSWLDAAEYWQAIIQAHGNKPKLCAKAAFNMALANEMMGNFPMAAEWLKVSQEYYLLPEIEWYKRVIEYRTKVIEKL